MPNNSNKQPTSSATETILAQHADAIRARGKRVIGDIIEIGRRLTEAKKIAGHGKWSPWLDREFGWTDDTALNFMRCHEMAKNRNFRDLSLPISGLYLLAAPSTPDKARAAVIERAQNGERLSVKDVRSQIDEAREKQTAEPAQAEGGFPIYGPCAGGRVVTERTSIKAKADHADVKQPMPDVRAAADRAEAQISASADAVLRDVQFRETCSDIARIIEAQAGCLSGDARTLFLVSLLACLERLLDTDATGVGAEPVDDDLAIPACLRRT